jgi:protein phosphatase
MTETTAAGTDVGRRRDHNEDDLLVTSVGDWTVLAVADGMGGHRAGDVASETALEAFASTLETRLGAGGTDVDAEAVLIDAVATANERVHERAAADARHDGMGTTLVAALVQDGEATLINVGDSRAYHVTDSAIERLTVDQSMVQQLIDEGVVDETAAADHPQRHVLSQALGTDDSVEPDVYESTITGTLVLCSDGVTEEVAEPTIRDVVVGTDPETAVERLLDTANENGGSDNATVVLWRA